MRNMGFVVFALVGGIFLLSGCSDNLGSSADYASDEAIAVTEIADGVFIIAPVKKPHPGASVAARKATTRKLKSWVAGTDYQVLSVCPQTVGWPYYCVTVRKPPQLPIEK